VQGQAGGAAAVALTANQCGQHTHAVTASTAASTNLAAGGFPAPAGTNVYGTGTSDTVMNPAAIAQAGAGAPHNNLQPYLVINFVISLSGLFPQRN
jgi:microcystin-dependent protein